MRRRNLLKALVKLTGGSTVAARVFVVIATSFLLDATVSHAEIGNPFSKLIGTWSGGGTIVLSDGTKERIRCRAGYAPADANMMSLQLELRCASDSYNFQLNSNLGYVGGSISGDWAEFTRGISGTISGTAVGDRIQVVAESPMFNATLNFTTLGDRQTVRMQSPGSEISEISISLIRGSR